MKQLTYKNEDNQIERYDITDEEADQITEFLTDPNRTINFDFKGQTFKASMMRVRNPQEQQNQLAYLEFHWEDQELEQFEKEIFEQFTTFDEYLIAEMVIDTHDRIKNSDTYRTLTAKWNRLNELRSKREKQTGFIGRKKWLAEIRVAQLANKMSIRKEPIEEPKEGSIEVDKIPF